MKYKVFLSISLFIFAEKNEYILDLIMISTHIHPEVFLHPVTGVVVQFRPTILSLFSFLFFFLDSYNYFIRL